MRNINIAYLTSQKYIHQKQVETNVLLGLFMLCAQSLYNSCLEVLHPTLISLNL